MGGEREAWHGMLMIETAPGPEDSPAGLPTDPEALRVLVREVIAERDAAMPAAPGWSISSMSRAMPQYGRSSEKLDDDQLRLRWRMSSRPSRRSRPRRTKPIPKKQRERAAARRGNRGALPEHLPRIIETMRPEHGLSLLPGDRCTRSGPTRASASTSFRPSIG